MRLLSIICDTHDSGLALIEDGHPAIILEEERLNRDKRTKVFPAMSLTTAFESQGWDLSDIDYITVPWDVKALRRTAMSMLFGRFPLSLSFISESANTAQSNDIVFLDLLLPWRLKKHFGVRQLPPIVYVGHHDSHAAAFFMSPFEEAAVLTMDGYGDDASTSLYLGEGNQLERRWNTSVINSLGIVYTLITKYLGFAGFSDEGKVMGLAAFGTDTYVERFRDVIHLTDDGQYAVNMDYFSHNTFGMIRPFKKKFFDVFGPERKPGDPLTDRQNDIAYALQVVIEEAILHIARGIRKHTSSKNLCLSGGVALNCVANARLLEETDFDNVWIPPCSSDTGVPLGSGLWHYHQTLGHERSFQITHAYFGTEYSDAEMVQALDEAGLTYERLEDDELIDRVADDLSREQIVAWFQGRFEIGPRALGNRSILSDPRNIDMKDKLNARVKHREAFRPFAPVVLEERVSDFFEIDRPDPYMTLAPRVRPDKVDLIPAAVHVDGTGRIQTIDRASNPRYYGVIEKFGELTGIPVLLNTSFNRQEPIVSRPSEAISCFLRTEMDVLVLGNYYTTDRNEAAIKRAFEKFAEDEAEREAAKSWFGKPKR